MPSKSALWGPLVKRGQKAIKICLMGPVSKKRGKMPSKYAAMSFISQKGA